MSSMQKYRHRQRLRRVDRIVACVDNALAKQGMVAAAVERWKLEMPTEAEMEPRDKYTLFDRNAKKYRKGVHSMFIPPTPGLRPTELTGCGCRGAEVDAGQPASQSAWILSTARGGGAFFAF